MQFPRSLLLALVSALAAYAQTTGSQPNPITNVGLAATAGQPVTITWTPTTGGTVNLILRSGASSDLDTDTVIASGVDNNGSYTWTPALDTVRGSDYAIEIQSAQNTDEVNYSGFFVIESDNTVASVTASNTPTTSLAPLPSTISTVSPTSSGMTTSMSGSSSMTSSGSMTSSRSMSTGASTTQAGLVATTTTSAGAGARATAMVGMLGAVALGAMAL